MSRVCSICGKGALMGNQISHAHNVSRKKQQPNLHTVSVNSSGNRRRVRTCTRCLKSGKIYAASR